MNFKLQYWFTFFAFFICLNGCKQEKPFYEKEKFTSFEGTLESLKGPKEEIHLLKNFPKPFYQIYNVPQLGAFYIDPRVDIIKNQLRNGLVWEEELRDIMKKYIKPGTLAIDIGAHIGTHTLMMSQLVGPKGHVIAFEPQIKLFSELVMNMVLNRCVNVKAYRCALGDNFKNIEMNAPVTDNEGGTGIGKGGDPTKMITLDSLNLENVSLIKIDVENFEYEVLLGAEKTIRKNKPYLIIEIMGNVYHPLPNRNELVNRTLQKVQEMGYKVEYISGSWSDWLASPL